MEQGQEDQSYTAGCQGTSTCFPLLLLLAAQVVAQDTWCIPRTAADVTLQGSNGSLLSYDTPATPTTPDKCSAQRVVVYW